MTDRGSGSRKQRATAKRGTKLPTQAASRPRRVSRREKEARQQKQIKYGIGIAAIIALVILGSFGVYNYVIKPNAVLASVNGVKIRREDYWKYRSLDLYNQVVTYQQYYSYVTDASEQQQYLALAQQAQTELQSVWGSTSVDSATLQQMVEDQVYLQSLSGMGLSINDEDVETWVQNQFAPTDAPLITPTPSPTLIPGRAAWATQTAQALAPSPTGTPATPSASPAASPVVGTPAATPATPAAGTPEASPSATMSAADALQTAQAGFDQYGDSVFSQVHMSRSDYLRLWAKPQLARQKVRDYLVAQIGQSADQVHAEHILVATQELAQQIYQDVTTGGQNFETVAKEKSTDTSTAPNGGDLGWFPRGIMVKPFEDAAFSGTAGQILPPVQTQYGWHIIKIVAVQKDRPLTDDMISQLQDAAVTNWLATQEASMKISSKAEPTPTAASQTFQAPPDAPTAPAEQATPAATPAAGSTPVASAATPAAGTPAPATAIVSTPPPATPIGRATPAAPMTAAASPAVPTSAAAAGTPKPATPTGAVSTPAPALPASPISTPLVPTLAAAASTPKPATPTSAIGSPAASTPVGTITTAVLPTPTATIGAGRPASPMASPGTPVPSTPVAFISPTATISLLPTATP